MSSKQQVVLHHQVEVDLPEDAKEVHYLLPCSVIRAELYSSGKIARQKTFWVSEDSVYAKMEASDKFYQIRLSIEDVEDPIS
jgi:hypothetical protein